MLTLQEKATKIWAEFQLDKNKSNNLVDFGVELLDSYDSDNLRILAGLDTADSEEKAKYFQKVMKEQGVTLPNEDKILWVEYGKIICNQIIQNEIEPIKGLRILSGLFVKSGYSRKFADFDLLETDIMNIHEGVAFNEGINEDTATSFIPRAAKIFLESEGREFPEDFWKMFYCKRCHRRGIPHYRTKFWKFLQTRKTQYPECTNCGSMELVCCDTIEGKEIFLRE